MGASAAVLGKIEHSDVPNRNGSCRHNSTQNREFDPWLVLISVHLTGCQWKGLDRFHGRWVTSNLPSSLRRWQKSDLNCLADRKGTKYWTRIWQPNVKRIYPTFESAVEKYNSRVTMLPKSAEILVRRGTEEVLVGDGETVEKGVCFRHDPKLVGTEIMRCKHGTAKWWQELDTEDAVRSFLRRISCPVLFIVGQREGTTVDDWSIDFCRVEPRTKEARRNPRRKSQSAAKCQGARN